MPIKKQLNFIYLFYNNNTRLQVGHEVILLGDELVRNIFGRRKPLEFFPSIKNISYSYRLWDLSPRPHSHSVVVLVHRLSFWPLRITIFTYIVFIFLYSRMLHVILLTIQIFSVHILQHYCNNFNKIKSNLKKHFCLGIYCGECVPLQKRTCNYPFT